MDFIGANKNYKKQLQETSITRSNIPEYRLPLSNLRKSTTIIYTSDHGDNVGRDGLFGKSTMYEESVGVPLIVKGKNYG